MPQENGVVNGIGGTVVGNVVQAGSITVTTERASARVALAGLPPQPVFVGRDTELAQLMDLLRPRADPADNAVVVSAVGGLGGIGKTALVVHAARRAVAEGWFPGGVLMIDMRGYDRTGQQLTASAAVRSMLVAIGLLGEQIPVEAAERERLWRSVLAEHDGPERRMLILVDNVSAAEQVRPLLPGGGHRVLVTSRTSLSGLQGARLLDLDVLPDESATTLLATELATARSDDDRVRSDPAAAARLVELCCGLPLALRTATALLAADPTQPLAELVADLADERRRLEALDVEADLSVRAAFNLSYHRLADDEARVFRLMALGDGPEIGTDAVAELVDADAARARRLLRRLVHAYLVVPGSSRGRWRMHDLLRLYASELAQQDPERVDATTRLLRHYVRVARFAARHLDPRFPPGQRGTHFTSRAEALTWLDTEYANLLAAVSLADTVGPHTNLRDLAGALDPYFDFRKDWNAWTCTARAAVDATRQMDDRPGELGALTSLGNAYQDIGQYDSALRCHERALALACELGDRFGESNALSNIGNAERARGRAAEAVRHYLRSLAIRRELGDRLGEARTLGNLGHAYLALGRPTEAIGELEKSLAITNGDVHREHGDLYGEGVTLHRLGDAHRGLGRTDEAERFYRRALDAHREHGDRIAEAATLGRLGDLWLETGRRAEGLACREEADELRRQWAAPVGAPTAKRDGDVFERYGVPAVAREHDEPPTPHCAGGGPHSGDPGR